MTCGTACEVTRNGLASWATVAAAGLGTAGRWLSGVRNGLTQVNQVVGDLGLQPADVTPEAMTKGVEDNRKIRGLRDELARIDRLTSTREWLQQRAQSTDYTDHFGVIFACRLATM